MRTPNAFPQLTQAILQLTTSQVKSFVERLHSAHSSSPLAAVGDGNELKRIVADARTSLASGASSGELDQTLLPLRDFDVLFRSLALANAAHWYAIVVETFIGTGHVGHRFEHEGAHYIFHEYRERCVVLVSGEVNFKAAHYRCENGGQGIYPLDIMLGLDPSGVTREAACLKAHFGSECDYPAAQNLIARATGLTIDQNRPHRRVQALGERARELQGQGEVPVLAEMQTAARLMVEVDGLMTPMRYDPTNGDPEKARAGWREAHVGMVAIPAKNKPLPPKYRRKNRSPERKHRTRADSHSDIKLVEASYGATYEGRARHLERPGTRDRRRTSGMETLAWSYAPCSISRAPHRRDAPRNSAHMRRTSVNERA